MLKNIKFEHFTFFAPIIFSIIFWITEEYIPSNWEEYNIPFKLNIFLLGFFLSIIIMMGLKIYLQSKQISSLETANDAKNEFKPVENYDLVQDTKGQYFCITHSKAVIQTGPHGYEKDAYFCEECGFWYENITNNQNKNDDDHNYPFTI